MQTLLCAFAGAALMSTTALAQVIGRPSVSGDSSCADDAMATPAERLPVEEPPPAETVALEDIAHWLRRNVPETWRQAALRRLWVIDPVIRDFIGPADYAWDWNRPGAAPGYGPCLCTSTSDLNLMLSSKGK